MELRLYITPVFPSGALQALRGFFAIDMVIPTGIIPFVAHIALKIVAEMILCY